MKITMRKVLVAMCAVMLLCNFVACGADSDRNDRDTGSSHVNSTVQESVVSGSREDVEATSVPAEEPTSAITPESTPAPTSEPTPTPTVEPTEIPVEVEYPGSPIPIYKEMVEPYCDVDKGEVALKDIVTGSIIKFTYDTGRFGVAVFEADTVYMYDKTDMDSWFEVRTVIDDVYPEIHSCEAYFNRHFAPEDKELTIEDFVLNNGISFKLYNRSWSYRGGGSYTTFITSGNNQGYYSVLPDGSTIMTSSIAREPDTNEAIESGKNFLNDLFLTFELYTTGGYTEESGVFAPAAWTVPQDNVPSYTDENGKKLFYYYKDPYSNTIVIGVVMNECVIPETIDGLPVTQCLTMSFTSSPKIVYPDSMYEMVRIGDRSSTIKYTENGWCDGAVTLQNLKRVESGATISTEGDVVLPDSIEYISGKVITDKTTGIVMPKNLRSLSSQYEFVYNGPDRPLKYVHFQEGKNSLILEASAFKGYKRLEEVVLSDNIIVIDN